MDEKDNYRSRTTGPMAAGLFILLIGGILLVDQLGFPMPDWLFNWHVLLIAIGIFLGLRHSFRGGAWMILVLVGGFFFVEDYFPELPLHRFIWPGVLIIVGLLVMATPRHKCMKRPFNPGGPGPGPGGNLGGPGLPDLGAAGPAGPEDPHAWRHGRHRRFRGFTSGFASTKEGFTSEDFINTTALFAGIHKKIVSKNFKGGDITSILGGTEIDLTQADFTGMVRLDVTQLLGGTKIIVPSHWEVRSEITAVFAGYEDKRQQPAISNPDKILILQGTSIFGGMELKNY